MKKGRQKLYSALSGADCGESKERIEKRRERLCDLSPFDSSALSPLRFSSVYTGKVRKDVLKKNAPENRRTCVERGEKGVIWGLQKVGMEPPVDYMGTYRSIAAKLKK